MRILIASPFYPPQAGILATYAAGLEAGFGTLGHEVAVLTPRLSLPPGIRHIEYFLRLFASMGGVSFVLSLDTWSAGVPAFFAARLRGKPVLLRVGGDFLWEQYLERTHEAVRLSEFYATPRPFSLRERAIRALTGRMLASARAVMFNTEFQKRIWESAYDIPRSSVLENFYPEKKTAAPPTNRAFVSAHRGAWLKNDALTAEAFSEAQRDHPDIRLDTRRVPHGEQLGRLASSYAVIISSVSEACSNTAIEAVSVGRPFIMTEDTGTKERLGECGLFIDTRSQQAMKEAIESLLDPAIYAKLTDAIARFSFTHSWEDMAREIIAAAS